MTRVDSRWPLRHTEALALRSRPGATVALFLTDRCPLACTHCSVSSTADGPTITDWPLFTALVDGLAGLPTLQAVAVTGGEPFAERRGLEYAVGRLRDAGKQVVIITGGYWARPRVPAWIHRVLASTDTVYLSVDSYHTAALGHRRPADAVRAIRAAGCHLVLQVLDEPGAVAAARRLDPAAELSLIRPVRAGRGAAVFTAPTAAPTADPAAGGRCGLLHSPTVRYDGTVTACCNEQVVTGAGPAGLRRRVSRADQVAPALASLRDGPALKIMARYGAAGAAAVTAAAATAPQPAGDASAAVCRACWALHRAVATDPRVRRLATVLGGAP